MRIVFNSAIDWDFNHNSQYLPENKVDFTTTALRAIARGLGFGSEIKMSRNFVSFNSSSTYPFNALIVNNEGEFLIDQPIRSTKIYNFVHSPAYINIFSNESSKNDYKLYAPPAFDKNLTFCYYDSIAAVNDNERIIMTNGLKGKVYYIGDKIIDALNEIGWEMVPQLDIKCDNIPSNGIITHNTSTDFAFYSTEKDITSYNWTYAIPQDNGDYRVIASGNDSVFNFSLPDKYLDSDKRSSSNLIKGRVRLNAIKNNSINAIADKAIYVRYKPAKPLLLIDTIHTDEYSYDLRAKFFSQGATGYYLVTNYLDYGDAYGRYIYNAGVDSIVETYLYKGENISFSVTAFNGNGNSDTATKTIYATIENRSSQNELPVIEYASPFVVHAGINESLKDCKWEIRVYHNNSDDYVLFPKNTTFTTGDADSLVVDLKRFVETYGTPDSKRGYLFRHDSNYLTFADIILSATNTEGESVTKKIPVKLNMIPKKPVLEIKQIVYDLDEAKLEGFCDLVISLKEDSLSPPADYLCIFRFDGGIESIDLSLEEASDYSTWFTKSLDDGPGYMEYYFNNGFAQGTKGEFHPFDDEVMSGVKRIKPAELDAIYNPSTKCIELRGEYSDFKSFSIYSSLGISYRKTPVKSNLIDVSNLPSGIYIMEITDKFNNKTIIRFLKN